MEPTLDANKDAIDRLLALSRPLALSEGINPTPAGYLTVVKRCRPSQPTVGVLAPAFCLILQGTKVVSFLRHRRTCSPGNFLASVLELPALVHVENASGEKPYLGLKVEFAAEDIASMIAESGIGLKGMVAVSEPASFVGTAYPEFLGLLEKILGLSDTPEDRFRAKLLKRDLVFSLLSGPYGHLFFPKAVFDEKAGISRAVAWIRDNFDKALNVDHLARGINMSASGLHHKFKALTTMGPLQFQKMLRLQEARRLLIAGGHDVSAAAYRVGYESPSQFSREYRRLFGLPPSQDMKNLRQLLAPSGPRYYSAVAELETI